MAPLWREYGCFMCTQAHQSYAFETVYLWYTVCKEKAKFTLWLTIWLSFERRRMFLETVLQILLTCVCHFSCSSTVTPSRRCFKTCSFGVVSKLKFKGSCCFWYFCLVAINTHFVLVGFSYIRFLQHHRELSFRLCCKFLRILIYVVVSCINGAIIRK